MRKNLESKDQAFKYYCMGLTSKEIEKLVNIPYRTIQGYMSRENWKFQRADLRQKEEKRIIRKYLKSSNDDTNSDS